MVFKLLFCFIMLLFVNVVYATQVTRDISYTYDGRQTLDLFVPEDAKFSEAAARPAVIVMHGGGWVSGDRYDMEYIAEWFVDQGFVVINVGYCLAPYYKWPEQFADVVQGVWWLKENAERYNINPNKILAVGASAGAYLAAMLGQSSVSDLDAEVDSEVHGIVSFSGPWNLLDARTEEQVYYISLLLPIDTPEARYLASPLFLISRHSPPVLIFHGTDDELVPFQQSKDVCKVYASKGLDYCALVPLEGYTHSSGVIDMNNGLIVDSLRKALSWWLTQ